MEGNRIAEGILDNILMSIPNTNVLEIAREIVEDICKSIDRPADEPLASGPALAGTGPDVVFVDLKSPIQVEEVVLDPEEDEDDTDKESEPTRNEPEDLEKTTEDPEKGEDDMDRESGPTWDDPGDTASEDSHAEEDKSGLDATEIYLADMVETQLEVDENIKIELDDNNNMRGEVIKMGKRSFACSLCPATSSKRASIESHIADNHISMEKKLAEVIKVGPGEYRCSSCGHTSNRSFNVKQHIGYAHTDEEDRPILCNMCPRRFGTIRDQLRHAEIHNKPKPTKKQVGRPIGSHTGQKRVAESPGQVLRPKRSGAGRKWSAVSSDEEGERERPKRTKAKLAGHHARQGARKQPEVIKIHEPMSSDGESPKRSGAGRKRPAVSSDEEGEEERPKRTKANLTGHHARQVAEKQTEVKLREAYVKLTKIDVGDAISPSSSYEEEDALQRMAAWASFRRYCLERDLASYAIVGTFVGPHSRSGPVRNPFSWEDEVDLRAMVKEWTSGKIGGERADLLKVMYMRGNFDSQLDKVGGAFSSKKENVLALMDAFFQLVTGEVGLEVFTLAPKTYLRDGGGLGLGVGVRRPLDATTPLQPGTLPMVYGDLYKIPALVLPSLCEWQLFSTISVEGRDPNATFMMLGPVQLVRSFKFWLRQH